jgi:carboxyl-terminal processing protease
MTSLQRILSPLFLVLACALVVADNPPADAKRIADLIQQMGSKNFEERQKANAALEAIGEPALQDLRQAAKTDADPEIRRRAAALVASIEGRFERARVFAKEVLAIVQMVHEQYVVEIAQGELAEWALRGLYEGCKRELSADLAKRAAATAKDLKADEVQALLRDGRAALGKLKELEEHKDVDLAIARMVGRLDPRCAYEEAPGLWIDPLPTAGVGLRLRVDPETAMIQVETPLRGGPAHKAGVRAGDLITHIVQREDADGKPLNPAKRTATKGVSLEDAEQKLRGKPGSRIHIVVQRPQADKPLEFALERGKVPGETVLGWQRTADASWDHVLDPANKIAYIRLTQFATTTDRELAEALQQLEKQGAKGLVLDLRFNPGGRLDTCVDTARRFIDKGTILIMKPRAGQEMQFGGSEAGNLPKLPMACLINGQSSSAAEVVAAALQDHKRAVIVGERSFGKGSVQILLTVNRDKWLKLTTALMYRPNGQKLDRARFPGRDEDEWGVLPDRGQEVKLTKEEQTDLAEQLRRREAITLTGQPLPDVKQGFKDKQLEQALEYVRGQIKKQ